MTRSVATIVERLGRTDAERLVAIVGGTRVYVPGHPKDGARLIARIGHDLAVRLILHFGTGLLAVPVTLDGRGAQGRPVDIRRVRRLLARGWSSARIARHLGCSERTIEAKRALLRSRAASTTPTSGDKETNP